MSVTEKADYKWLADRGLLLAVLAGVYFFGQNLGDKWLDTQATMVRQIGEAVENETQRVSVLQEAIMRNTEATQKSTAAVLSLLDITERVNRIAAETARADSELAELLKALTARIQALENP